MAAGQQRPPPSPAVTGTSCSDVSALWADAATKSRDEVLLPERGLA